MGEQINSKEESLSLDPQGKRKTNERLVVEIVNVVLEILNRSSSCHFVERMRVRWCWEREWSLGFMPPQDACRARSTGASSSLPTFVASLISILYVKMNNNK